MRRPARSGQYPTASPGVSVASFIRSAINAKLQGLDKTSDVDPTDPMADRLLAEGIYVRAFSFPVVPRGKARIRTQMSAAHSREDLDRAITAFEKSAYTRSASPFDRYLAHDDGALTPAAKPSRTTGFVSAGLETACVQNSTSPESNHFQTS